jgi:hypothetical protein
MPTRAAAPPPHWAEETAMTADVEPAAPTTVPTARGGALAPIAIGAVAGLAWAAGFRAFMIEVAGAANSTFQWYGTFAGILLPGAVTGALLGWAEHLRRTGGRRGWRWLALAPLVFVVPTPSVLVSVFTDGGIGGGAIGIPLFAMAGGYAVSGRGPRWARAVAGLLGLVPVLGFPIVGAVVDGGIATAREGWGLVLFSSSTAVLALGCAIPHLPVLRVRAGDRAGPGR